MTGPRGHRKPPLASLLLNPILKSNFGPLFIFAGGPLKEHVSVNNIVIMNFTETWFKKEDQDEKISNYAIFRGDRKGGKTKGGGVAIYI